MRCLIANKHLLLFAIFIVALRVMLLINYQQNVVVTQSLRSALDRFAVRQLRKPSQNDKSRYQSRDLRYSLQRMFTNKGTFVDTVALLGVLGHNCTRLLTDDVLQFLQTRQLHEHLVRLETQLKSIYSRSPDGHAGLFPAQMALYVLISHQPWARQVCEIGFNAGHSALFWLVGGDKTKLVSFDLGVHRYAKSMGEYMQKTYVDRIKTVWGDSATTVPEFWRSVKTQSSTLNTNSVNNNAEVFNCDVIVIDGCHQTECVIRDVRNMLAGANRQRHLVILDDALCSTSTCIDVGNAIHTLRSEGVLGSYGACTAYPDTGRGMTFGYYL